ncbi:hypothetical protein [Streptomyces melanosporofaciens]|uniref:Uncharacterized protein n=1 Tax=Streptomyces melanosporofaciens TaxID=67327 RepID=A0A1H4MPM7_STRMJ|nr:hypothetical protein [Streptomyces melanosporofaciens]SEB84986.1 hypothetical protein SAMN04490356_1917 [Streptomyces melanosporofaciens]
MRTCTSRKNSSDGNDSLAVAHGTFNVVGGLWPLLHLRSFEWVFGPKTDRWLQQAVGGLLVSNGVSQLVGATSAEGRTVARRVGLTTALTLLAIDLVYVPKGRIRPTYLLDAAMEAGWITAWLHTPCQSPAGKARTGSGRTAAPRRWRLRDHTGARR